MTNPAILGRKRNLGRWLIFTSVLVGIGLFFTFGPDEQTIIHRSAEWREAARNNLLSGLALFFIAEVLLIAFSVPIGIWLTILAGFLFGTWLGIAVVNLGATLGAILAFLSARYVFADALRKSTENRPRLKQWLNSIDNGFREHGTYCILLLRLMPLFPFWAINLGLGLTTVRLRNYWWATQLGMLPVSLATVNAGAKLAEITSFRQVLSLQVLGALSLLPLIPFALHLAIGRWLSSDRRKASKE